MHGMMPSRTIALGATVLLLLSACGEDEPPRVPEACTPDPAGAPLTDADVGAPGPFAVGKTTSTFVDETRTTPAHGGVDELPSRTLPVTIWYPATEAGDDVPVAGGPFPLVIYSHGFSSFQTEGAPLNAHLASHGYVVVAPEFPLTHLGTTGGPTGIDLPNQPGDVSFLIDTMLAADADPESPFVGAIDDARIAAVGLSLGGLTTLLATYHVTLHDPRIIAAAVMAPPADLLAERFYDTRTVPLLILSGTIDAIVSHEENAVVAMARANAPVSLLTLEDGTHTGFTSLGLALDGIDNADAIGCDALDGGGGMPDGEPFDRVAALGGEEAGIIATEGGLDCMGPLPYAMRPTRQLEITRLAIRSFLDAYLVADPVARGRSCHYNERVLPRAADLDFTRR